MDSTTATLLPPESKTTTTTPPNPPKPIASANDRDFLNHLEAYLSKRDGVDKLLKISRYAAKIVLSSSILPETLILTTRLKSFESSVGLSRKAFRLGKFVQDVNALRSSSHFGSQQELVLSILAYGGEGIYYFVEQFVWLSKSGLIDARHAKRLGKISAWAEFAGYVGSISLKFRDLNELSGEMAAVSSMVEIADSRGEEEERMKKLKAKMVLKRLSIVQDFADGFMALADIRDGKGKLSSPLFLSCAGLLSAIISTQKNWASC
ncbi:unnamed protein product [Linum trigynum]|uniref:Peroxisomal membrane protein 11A n=1 Tax=Linum trigynum TaxID=586398 RepID=A0AAV2GNI2_9ROSI